LVVGVSAPPETFLARLLTGLVARGVEVTVAAPRNPRIVGVRWLPVFTASEPRATRLGNCLRVASRPWGFLLAGRAFPVTPAALRAALRQAPFMPARWDAVYFPWMSHVTAIPAAARTGAPVIVSCRGSQITVTPHDPDRPAIKHQLDAAFRAADAIHCVSRAIGDEAVKYGADPAKITVIRPAVDPQVFTPRRGRVRNAGDVFRIAMTGSLIWRKGHEYAVVALRELAARGVAAELGIVGDGPDVQRILFTADDLGVRQSIELYGKQPPPKVLEHLRRADVFLLASLEEGISNAVLEAMSCGLTVVTTDCGGMREAVTDGVEGFVVPRRDPVAMADRLAEVASAPEMAQRMGAAARERVVREFSLDGQIDGWCGLLRSVVTAGGGRETRR